MSFFGCTFKIATTKCKDLETLIKLTIRGG